MTNLIARIVKIQVIKYKCQLELNVYEKSLTKINNKNTNEKKN